jgi:glucokinase
MKRKFTIGVDLGGTKILTGVIDNNGNVTGSPVRVQTGGNDDAESILKRITGSIESAIKDQDLKTEEIEGIGIGATGPLDIEKGLILECPQLPNMHFFPLRQVIQDHFRLPVRMNNDANCFAYGETVFGAAAGSDNVLGFTLGTGLGCALVLDGKLVNGATGTAAEIWTSPYRSGIIEDYVSGSGVSKIYNSISGLDRSSPEIFELAAINDQQALQTWKEFGIHLAYAIAWSVNIVDPGIVVLGGSITAAWPFFRESMEESMRKWVCPVPAKKTKVVLSKLGDYAGIIGAASLFMDII